MQKIWVVLGIGNSRDHWAWFLNTELQVSWDTPSFDIDIITYSRSGDSIESDLLRSFPQDLQALILIDRIAISTIPIYLVSVVPSQTKIWQQLPQVRQITLTDVPLLNLYPTLGIDRALAILGAGENYGYPVLVIDGGTALTITGVNQDRSLVGGAIIPGLGLQFRSLFIGTAKLPEVEVLAQLPSRWGCDTSTAISSGVLYTATAGIADYIQDWERLFPNGQILFTGGDGQTLAIYLKLKLPEYIAKRIVFDLHLIFKGVLMVVDQ